MGPSWSNLYLHSWKNWLERATPRPLGTRARAREIPISSPHPIQRLRETICFHLLFLFPNTHCHHIPQKKLLQPKWAPIATSPPKLLVPIGTTKGYTYKHIIQHMCMPYIYRPCFFPNPARWQGLSWFHHGETSMHAKINSLMHLQQTMNQLNEAGHPPLMWGGPYGKRRKKKSKAILDEAQETLWVAPLRAYSTQSVPACWNRVLWGGAPTTYVGGPPSTWTEALEKKRERWILLSTATF